MKIAIPCADGRLCMHFGHCENFAFVEVDENKNITGIDLVKPPHHAPGVYPGWVKEQGADIVIAGGMGGGAVEIFNERNIEVIVGASGDAKAAAESYLRGELKSTGSVCHEHEHSDACGEH